MEIFIKVCIGMWLASGMEFMKMLFVRIDMPELAESYALADHASIPDWVPSRCLPEERARSKQDGHRPSATE